MNTNEVAQKWLSMCREGKNMECVKELYAENIVSQEMPGMPNEIVSGKQNVWNKSQKWYENIQEFHSAEISEPIVAGNHFTSTMKMDVTFKDQGRTQMEEVCVFKVQNGQIVNEQFFYDME